MMMSLEPGRYRILSAQSLEPIHVIRVQPGEEPTFCAWKVHHSPIEKWIVERQSNCYHIRNEATDLYLSFRENITRPIANEQVVGNSKRAEWTITSFGSAYKISLVLNPVLHIAANTESKAGGKELIFRSDVIRRPRLIAGDNTSHADEHFLWIFVKDACDEPPIYRRNTHLGPIPSGLYWLGQAEIRTMAASQAAKLPPTGAITVTSRSPPQNQTSTSLHLGPVSEEPWPHQIWMMEAGGRGYCLRNVGTNMYLTLVNREAVAEVCSLDSSPFEWCIKAYPKRHSNDIQSYTLSPLTDLSCFLTTNFDSPFNKVEAKQSSRWRNGRSHIEWRFGSVDPKLLEPVTIQL